jgi:eukaryotic-like serine/threonine-protein kinase
MAVVGEIVAGRFRLVRPVGTGGMGAVWLAQDEVLARNVAVKEIVALPGFPPGHADVWARTVREARTCARLTHPNVVRVYDVLFTAGRPWIVMEFVVGRSLFEAVRRDGPLPPQEVTRIGLAVLDGLDAAHRAGVLHRDVKPHNVLLADDGRILLGDFGVAVFDAGSVGWHDAMDEVVLGSPGYVAPERVSEGASTVKTDLWSLGATLHWMLEGHPPADETTQRPGVLAEVIDGLLQRRPEDRLTAAQARSLLGGAALVPPAPAPSRALEPLPPALEPVTQAPAIDEGQPVSEPAVDAAPAVPLPDRRAILTGAAAAPPPEPAVARPVRRAVVVGFAVAAAAAAVATAASAATVVRPNLQRTAETVAAPRPASLTCAAAADPSLEPAGAAAASTPVKASADSAALPAGWVRALDDGFSIGVPRGWQRSTDRGAICLLEPDGRRAVAIEGAPLDPDRVAYWQREAGHLRAGHGPDGYELVDISPALFQGGGADWEYRYQAGGVRWHVLRRAFGIDIGAAPTSRAYVISWTTTDADWDRNQPDFRSVMQSFEIR